MLSAVNLQWAKAIEREAGARLSEKWTIIEIIATHSDGDKRWIEVCRVSFVEHTKQGLPVFKHADQSIIDLGINVNNNALQTSLKLQIHPSRLEHVDLALVLCDRRIMFSGCRRAAVAKTAGSRLDMVACSLTPSTL